MHKIGYRIIIDNAIQGKDIEVWGDPTRKKDMVYVKDFCFMLYLALLTSRSEGHYNVGTGIGTTLGDQIKSIVSVFGDKKKSNICFCPEKQNAPQYIMDITNAQSELGYEPKYLFPNWLYDFKREMIKS
jgi:UDP-glucose 4-epimerase